MSDGLKRVDWEIRSTIKEVVGWGEKLNEQKLVEKVAETQEVSEDAVESVLQEMIKDGTLFKPDSKSVERT